MKPLANEGKLKLFSVRVFLAAATLSVAFAFVAFKQYLADQQVRAFSSEVSRALKSQICPSEHNRANPCGQKNIQSEADSGLIVYLYIYGITEPKEVEVLSKAIEALRRSKETYRKIPIKVTFYSDLQKSSVEKTFWIFGA